MKIKQLIVACGMAAALMLSVGMASAQDNGNGGGPGGGGGGGGRGGRGGWGDPAQMQQRMMDNIKDQLGFTNDTDWDAVQPLVQKVLEAKRDAGGGNLMRLMRPNRGGGQGGPGGNNRQRGGGMFGGAPNPDAEALQKALDDNAPSGQVKELLTKYQAAQKTKQAKVKDAVEALRQVLTPKQEAQATLDGLLD